ncbi:uncharacterized protein LOC110272071 [Arachis ipaensis]|uniref:uncharacterized protein LOC110272071 n=1 Tax=Arachis ipaensis TaxID=130454 RepID=UPI000A2B3357|nr:uncharacterized protein LOC110272071 [Arachis ipaensis]
MQLNSLPNKIGNCIVVDPFLHHVGYDIYLVGGCVQDLILKQISKDFDIITSADLKEVLRTFPWCEIVGKKFSICHVRMDGTIVEVSSFNIATRKSNHFHHDIEAPSSCDKEDYLRWRNCLKCDFTING